MKLHVLSDLHLEFEDFKVPHVDADLLVLAGDIAKGQARLKKFLASIQHRPVVMVAGNHEFYGEAIPTYFDKLRAITAATKIHFLENEALVIGDLRILGCSLWTDFGLFGVDRTAQVMACAGMFMSDYTAIRKAPEYGKLRPSDTVILHHRSRKFLEKSLAQPFDGKTVVVTHHAPCRKSVRPEHLEDLVSAAFASSLEPLILNAKIELWIHGHTHYCVDYFLGNTRVLSNQRGYPGESVGKFDPGLIIEI